jgi:hypothetical protein
MIKAACLASVGKSANAKVTDALSAAKRWAVGGLFKVDIALSSIV